jgi:hypothetical protein
MYMLKTAGVDFNFRLPDSGNLHADAEVATDYISGVRVDSSVR